MPQANQKDWRKKLRFDSAFHHIKLFHEHLHQKFSQLGYVLSQWLLKNKEVSKTIAIEVGMQNSGLGVVLAQENFANPMTAIPAAISSLVHSVYGSIFTVLFSQSTKNKTL